MRRLEEFQPSSRLQRLRDGLLQSPRSLAAREDKEIFHEVVGSKFKQCRTEKIRAPHVLRVRLPEQRRLYPIEFLSHNFLWRSTRCCRRPAYKKRSRRCC